MPQESFCYKNRRYRCHFPSPRLGHRFYSCRVYQNHAPPLAPLSVGRHLLLYSSLVRLLSSHAQEVKDYHPDVTPDFRLRQYEISHEYGAIRFNIVLLNSDRGYLLQFSVVNEREESA